MEPIIVLKDFKPEYYICDKNDDDAVLGSGAYGDVYRAKLKDDNAILAKFGLPKEVAIKTINWKLPASRYKETEWNLLKSGFDFKNDNIVQMFCLSMEVTRINKRRLSIYMELCDAALDDFLSTQDMSLADLKHVMVGVLSGLDHLHCQGIIHRDLKQPNILLKKQQCNSTSLQDMVIKLADFNVSKWIPLENTSATMTAQVGTAAFRSPEVLLFREDGKTHYGRATDVWALGILVFQLRMKEDFANEQDIKSDQLDKIIDSRIKTIPEKELQSFLHQCLKKNPKQRNNTKCLLNHIFLESGNIFKDIFSLLSTSQQMKQHH